MGVSNLSYLLLYKQEKWLFSQKLDLALSGAGSVYSFPPTSNSWPPLQTHRSSLSKGKDEECQDKDHGNGIKDKEGVPVWLSELISDS